MEDSYYKLLNDVLLGYKRNTPAKITTLRNNQIFVFGTDTNGSQKHGAAGLAAKCFGAKVGAVDGLTGRCYALPTKGFSIEELSNAVIRFEKFVRENCKYQFLVTAIGCGHAGFDVMKVANMFRGLLGLSNVMLPEAFLKVYRAECKSYFLSNCIAINDKTLDDKIFDYYDERVHSIIRYLIDNNIPFSKEGGFSLQDSEGNVISEAELGIEAEKIVFYPFNSQSDITFKNNGYKVCNPKEYLNSKNEKNVN
ncbi:MAG: hypothetical protein EOM50_07405 [Erysipelotrichia bacterium]|nr:hypothetical protein [Erysipelotrichia bacterium]